MVIKLWEDFHVSLNFEHYKVEGVIVCTPPPPPLLRGGWWHRSGGLSLQPNFQTVGLGRTSTFRGGDFTRLLKK